MQLSTGAVEGAFDFAIASSVHVLVVADNARDAAAATTLNGATGYLVTITSAAENDFLTAYVNAPNIWIGANGPGGAGPAAQPASPARLSRTGG